MLLDQKLLQLINRNCKIKLEIQDISDDLDLVEYLGLDSMTFVQLIVDIEEEFEIEIPDEKLQIEYMRCYKNMRKSILEQIEL
nr:phosphopantetheine-binding protein [uncultured Acetatifactor sp.]